jgi:pimeloyl-ACP methyl ester carboxylesterase
VDRPIEASKRRWRAISPFPGRLRVAVERAARSWCRGAIALGLERSRMKTFAVLAIALGAVACGDRPASPRPQPLDADACRAFASRSTDEESITVAEWIASDGEPAGGSLPDHCRLRGVLDDRVGRAGVRYAIGFELRLPALWNRRFYFQGGFGTDGSVDAAVGGLVGRGSALSLGYAVVSTDAGHAGAGPEFGIDPQARVDYGYRAIDRVTRRAKELIARAYGSEPERSYFVGCSNGGRQGFVGAQRFPDLFDGIVAGAPGFNLPKAAIAEAWNTQAIAAIATRVDANGSPFLADTFSDADLALLSNAVLGACDANDGLADGIVDDLLGCRFDPAVLACPVEKTSLCLSEAQIGALKKVFAGPIDSLGEPLYSDFPYDGGIGDPSPIGSLRGWTLGNPHLPGNSALNITLGAGALAFIFITPPVDDVAPLDFVLGFDFDRDAPKIFATAGDYMQSSMDFMSAASTDLSAFRRRGGKLLVYHGASDGVFSVRDTIRWYEGVNAAADGRAGDFARLFVVPGMGHCVGGPATDRFDAFGAIVEWVEAGVAPDQIVATASPASPFPGRSRPLCPYPQQSRYRGAGSIESASSFVCR